jgi:hypothetical protein
MEADVQEMRARLEPFIGTWEVEGSFPLYPDVPDLHASATFEWGLGGTFLVQRMEASHPTAPSTLALVGVDAEGGAYTQHYFDSRGVARTYAMTFDGRVWTLTRETADFTPLEFSQRFTGTFDDSGTTITGQWEICHDGTTWEHDFDLTYTKVE